MNFGRNGKVFQSKREEISGVLGTNFSRNGKEFQSEQPACPGGRAGQKNGGTRIFFAGKLPTRRGIAPVLKSGIVKETEDYKRWQKLLSDGAILDFITSDEARTIFQILYLRSLREADKPSDEQKAIAEDYERVCNKMRSFVE